MTLAELKDILAATGLPVTYCMWPVGSAPSLPFICYRVLESRNFAADGEVYQPADLVSVELYTAQKDLVSEAKVEEALHAFVWQKEETYSDDEKCYIVYYEIEV